MKQRGLDCLVVGEEPWVGLVDPSLDTDTSSRAAVEERFLLLRNLMAVANCKRQTTVLVRQGSWLVCEGTGLDTEVGGVEDPVSAYSASLLNSLLKPLCSSVEGFSGNGVEAICFPPGVGIFEETTLATWDSFKSPPLSPFGTFCGLTGSERVTR